MNMILKKYDKCLVVVLAVIFFLVMFAFLQTQEDDVKQFAQLNDYQKSMDNDSFGNQEIENEVLAVDSFAENEIETLFFAKFKNNFQRKDSSSLFSPGTFCFCEKDFALLPLDIAVCPCGAELRPLRPEKFDSDTDEGGVRDDWEFNYNSVDIVKNIATAVERPVYFNIENPMDDKEDPDGDGFTNAEEVAGKEIKANNIQLDAFNPEKHPPFVQLLRLKEKKAQRLPLFFKADKSSFIAEDKERWEASISLIDLNVMRQYRIDRKLLATPRGLHLKRDANVDVQIGDYVFSKYAGNEQKFSFDFKVVDFSDDKTSVVLEEVALSKSGQYVSTRDRYTIKNGDEPTIHRNRSVLTLLYLIDRVEPEEGENADKLEEQRCHEISLVVYHGRDNNLKNSGDLLSLSIPSAKEYAPRKNSNRNAFRSLVGYDLIKENVYDGKDPILKKEEYDFVRFEKDAPVFKKRDEAGSEYVVDKKFDPEADLVVPNNGLIKEETLDDEDEEEDSADSRKSSSGSRRNTRGRATL